MGEPLSISRSRPRVRERWAVVALCIVLSLPTTWMQLFGISAAQSDYGPHLAAAEHLQQGHLEVSHFLFHGAVALLAFVLTIPIATIVVIALAQIALGLLIFHVMCGAFETGGRSAEQAARWALVTTVALLISAPINLFTFPKIYLGYIPTMTYHSPTVQLLKPLALVLFLRLDRDVLAEPTTAPASSGLLPLALLGVVTTLAMPSFSIVVLPALVMMMLVYHQTLRWRRALAILVVLGLAVCAVILWQMLFLFPGSASGGGGGSGEGVAFQPLVVASMFAPDRRLLVGKLLLSVVFPVVALLCNWRAALADRRLVFSYACFVVSLLYYLLLTERGTRMYHGNFLWGVMVSLLLVFLCTSAMLARRGATALRATRAGWLTLGLHVICGVVWLAAANSVLGHLCDDGYGNWCW